MTNTIGYLKWQVMASNVVSSYRRYKIKEQWSGGGDDPTEEPTKCEFIICIDPRPGGGHSFYSHLSWEQWCRVMSPDGDIEEALRNLRAKTSNEYHLEKKYDRHVLVFNTRAGAQAVAESFCSQLGSSILDD